MPHTRPVSVNPAPPAARRRGIDVDGLTFRVISDAPATPGSAAPVVLVHGIGVSHRYLSRLHRELATDREVHSIDLPGYGGLPKPGRDLPVSDMAHALAAVLAAIDLAPVILLGHSMGSQWVVELAVQRPDLVSEVVAMGPVTDAAHRTLPRQLVALARDTLGETPHVNVIIFSDYLRCGLRWYSRQLRHMLSYPIEERVGELRVPLLVIRGARDPIAGREWCRSLRDAAPAGTLVEIPRAHHVAQHTAPHAVASALRALAGKPAVTS